MKPFLILQIRTDDVAADDEFAAFLRAGGMPESATRRIRMEKAGLPAIDLDDYSGVIVGGGPYCVSDATKTDAQIRVEKDCHELLEQIVARDFPYFGACYGLGVLANYLGGAVSKEKYSEGLGAIDVELNAEGKSDDLLTGLPESFRAFGGHKEASQIVPPGAVLLASSRTCPVQLIRVKQNIYGTQFHPELDSKGLQLRIKTYRYAGYFHPDEADALIAMAAKETAHTPQKIIKRFIEKYSTQVDTLSQAAA